MSDGFLCFLALYLMFSTVASCGIWNGVMKEIMDKYFYTPQYLYRNTTMNKFGCCLCSFLICISIPFYFVIMFVYWLLHTGREKD